MNGPQSPVVAFDIDGTLASGPFNPSNLRSLDTRPEIVRTLRLLKRAGTRIIVVTARPESKYGQDTRYWLRRQAIPHDELRMRPEGDNRPDPELRSDQVAGASILFDDKPENCAAVAIRCVRV